DKGKYTQANTPKAVILGSDFAFQQLLPNIEVSADRRNARECGTLFAILTPKGRTVSMAQNHCPTTSGQTYLSTICTAW
ncbi:MAG: hypothetical protein AAFV25_17595, partial [Bacteroidota bacterium]